ncbi:MAG: hypothetical protein M0R51_06865 [Clostridia bacterium]|jgi:hypothetical protein|nr:hypothetical protein [Clostridia bacterium]
MNKLKDSTPKGGEGVFIEIDDFKKDKKLQTENPMLRKYYNLDPIKSIEDTANGLTVDFVISTNTIDRSGDSIDADGWELDNYRKNPVILWAHDYTQPPVAKSLSETIASGKLMSKAQFAPRDLSEMGYMVGQMYAKGFMNAVSVGFRGLDWSFSTDKNRPMGIDFTWQELMEYSTVPVPCNPEALMAAKSVGVDTNPMLKWAVEVLDKSDLSQKKAAERVWKLLESKKSYFIPFEKAQKPPTTTVKGVSPGNPSGYGKAPEDTTWSALTLQDFTDQTWDSLSDAEKNNIAKHFAWSAEMPPDTFGDLKLGHHNTNGDVVWNGVANAAARLSQTDIPEADVVKVQNHLAKHYKEFDKTPPWEKDAAEIATQKAKLALQLAL